MSKDQDFEIEVNGRARRFRAAPDMPLLYALRDLLDETETRFGCGDGLCGACTVTVGGRAMHACDMPISAVTGPVETAASLRSGDGDHPILTALTRHAAGQCGYCLAGIAMRARAFLESQPGATRAEIARALDGNLCRCGAHNRILDALEEAAREMEART